MEGTHHKEEHCVCLSVSLWSLEALFCILTAYWPLPSVSSEQCKMNESPCIHSYDCCIKLQGTQWLKMIQTLSQGWLEVGRDCVSLG